MMGSIMACPMNWPVVENFQPTDLVGEWYDEVRRTLTLLVVVLFFAIILKRSSYPHHFLATLSQFDINDATRGTLTNRTLTVLDEVVRRSSRNMHRAKCIGNQRNNNLCTHDDEIFGARSAGTFF